MAGNGTNGYERGHTFFQIDSLGNIEAKRGGNGDIRYAVAFF